jgi:hypothetical protein
LLKIVLVASIKINSAANVAVTTIERCLYSCRLCIFLASESDQELPVGILAYVRYGSKVEWPFSKFTAAAFFILTTGFRPVERVIRGRIELNSSKFTVKSGG